MSKVKLYLDYNGSIKLIARTKLFGMGLKTHAYVHEHVHLVR